MLNEQPRVDLAPMETASFCFARGGGAKRSRPSSKTKDTVDSGLPMWKEPETLCS